MPPRDAYAIGPGRRLALRASVGITGADPDTRTGWIDVAGPGVWNGHPDGPFELTVETFAACIAAFDEQTNPIGVDYDHASLSVNPDGGAPASGWVQKLELRGDRLFALVEWTVRAAASIRAGEHRFCSGVFDFQAIDRKTGEASGACVLDSIALTNRPFIDGQQPIALTVGRTVCATGESPARALEQVMPEETPPPAAQVDDAGKMLAARLMEATGMDAAALLAALDAKLEAVVAALKGEAPATAPPAAPAAVAPASEVGALTAQLTALTAQVHAQAVELAPLRANAAKAADAAVVAEVDSAIALHKIQPGARDAFVKLAREAPSSFRAIVATLGPSLPPSTAPALVPPSQAHSVDKESKRRELTARVGGTARGILTPKQIEETVNRQMADLYPEGN